MDISRQEANDHIREYLGLREETSQQNLFAQQSNTKTTNYFAAPATSFVFKKEDIDALVAGPQANAIRIYYAAHPADGSPTLVVVPCTLNTENNSIYNLIVSEQSTALQHPIINPSIGTSTSFDIANDDIS